MKVRARLVHCDSLSCEPILRRAPDGDLLCVSQCGDVTEPAPGNRVYAFRSEDDGNTWSGRTSVYPETGEAVYCTEVTVLDGVVTAYLTVHSGRFLNMRCVMMQSRDSGRTWTDAGPPPFFPTYCFIRAMIPLPSGACVWPYQHFPISDEENTRLVVSNHNITEARLQRGIWAARIDHMDTGVIHSTDGGRTATRFKGPRIDIKGDTGRSWAWTEPTVAQLSDGTLAMLLRVDGTGRLWRSDSRDEGRTWSDAVPTDIPNPGNKPKLIGLSDGRIALIHTPNPQCGMANRHPLALWISDDDMRSFADPRVVTDFPGRYCYPDGFEEDGHILFTIEINRHEILFFDCTV